MSMVCWSTVITAGNVLLVMCFRWAEACQSGAVCMLAVARSEDVTWPARRCIGKFVWCPALDVWPGRALRYHLASPIPSISLTASGAYQGVTPLSYLERVEDSRRGSKGVRVASMNYGVLPSGAEAASVTLVYLHPKLSPASNPRFISLHSGQGEVHPFICFICFALSLLFSFSLQINAHTYSLIHIFTHTHTYTYSCK